MSMTCPPAHSAFVDSLCRRAWSILFGREIQGIREEKGWSVEEAAGRAGMTAAAWDAIECGRVPQTWEQACAVADGLEESHTEMASLVILYAGAWEHGPSGDDVPREIRQMYS